MGGGGACAGREAGAAAVGELGLRGSQLFSFFAQDSTVACHYDSAKLEICHPDPHVSDCGGTHLSV
jgi:hypothetical protein